MLPSQKTIFSTPGNTFLLGIWQVWGLLFKVLQKDKSPLILLIHKNCYSDAFLFNANSVFHSYIFLCKIIDAILLCNFMTNATMCSLKQNLP